MMKLEPQFQDVKSLLNATLNFPREHTHSFQVSSGNFGVGRVINYQQKKSFAFQRHVQWKPLSDENPRVAIT